MTVTWVIPETVCGNVQRIHEANMLQTMLKACCRQIILSLSLQQTPCFVYDVYEQSACGSMVGTIFLFKMLIASQKKKNPSAGIEIYGLV